MRAMTLLTLRAAHLAYGQQPLLDDAQLALAPGERIGLIGRNGAGKSTLLKVIAGRVALDAGALELRDGLRVVFVEQEPELAPAPTLRDSVLANARRAALGHDTAAPEPDEREEHARAARVARLMDQLDLSAELDPGSCSGGQLKRAALAAAFAAEPDLLLLDEPTNHLDIEAIEQLEELLMKVPASVVVTHDREFLDRTTTRIVELDRGTLRSYAGNFARYELEREAQSLAEAAANRRFDQLLAQEEVWIRKGVEARRTRNEGRVRRLEQLREERALRRERLGRMSLTLDAGERSGRLVAELTGVSKRFGTRPLIERLSARVMRGDRIGIIGPNGAGKSTLIRIILGTLQPDEGAVRLGTNLAIAYFDQLREELDPERTLGETIGDGSEWIEIGGRRLHITSYLGDFLFSPQRARAPVKMLSGGERNRLLLARLFARPANLLVLDEPTNDLDIESLELLEQTLQEYPGTVLLVSHDRRFLDSIVTQTLAPEGGGGWREYVGGYSDWLAQRTPAAPTRTPARKPAALPRERARTKLSYKEERELAALPQDIEALEREQAELTARMSRPEYYREGAERVREDGARVQAIESLLAEKFARWEALEQLRAELK
jgi:ATP-binding cassette subfamily F protein uup